MRAGHYHRRRRREFLDFMNDLVALYEPDTELHVILDNLSTHKPKRDRWLACHPRVHFHYTPTHASWLNQIEIWFSKLSRAALQGASFASVRELRQAAGRRASSGHRRLHRGSHPHRPALRVAQSGRPPPATPSKVRGLTQVSTSLPARVTAWQHRRRYWSRADR